MTEGGGHLTRLTEADLPAILALEEASFSQPWTRENFLGELRRRVTVAIGLKQDGFLLAHCFFWLIAPEIHLLNVAVSPAFRGRGLARRLISAMLGMGRKAGADTVFLEVRRGNMAALGLYRSFGFREAGIRPDYYEDGEDALMMTLEL